MAKKSCDSCPYNSCKCSNRVPLIIVLNPEVDTAAVIVVLSEIAPDFEFKVFSLKNRPVFFGKTSPKTILNVFKAEAEIVEKEYPNLNGPPRKLRFWKPKTLLQAPDRIADQIERVFIPVPNIVLTD